MKISLINQILAAAQTAPSQVNNGLENVNASNGWLISAVGLLTVFIGLIILVLAIKLFGKFFTMKRQVSKKEATTENSVSADTNKIPAESDETLKKISKTKKVNNVKSATSENQSVVEKKAPEISEKELLEQDKGMQEILAAVALAIHAELNLYHPDIVSNIDYPSEVPSWAISSRPLRNSHFDKLYRNH